MGPFLGVIGGLVALLSFYAWRRLVRAPAWPRAARRTALVALVVLGAWVPIAFAAPRWADRETPPALVLVGAAWAGVLFLTFATLVAMDVVRIARWIGRRATRGPAPVNLDRRRFLARAAAGVTGATAAGLSGIAIADASRAPVVERRNIPIARLPVAFEGFRIVQWSDVHANAWMRREVVEDLVRRTNALDPHVIAITGDLVDGDVATLAPILEPLRDLRARHGVFFTTGNHEYYAGVDAWLAHLPTLGVRVLRNERVAIDVGGGSIDVAGIDDASARAWPGHGADLDRALAGRDAARPVVLLAHQPKQVRDAQRLGVDLVLSGHTHGGQIAPFGLFVRLAQPAVRGLHRFGATWLYVSRGTGTWGPPMRLANSAEITLLELVRA